MNLKPGERGITVADLKRDMLKILVKTPESCAVQSFRTEMYANWPKCGSRVDLKAIFDVVIGFVKCISSYNESYMRVFLLYCTTCSV